MPLPRDRWAEAPAAERYAEELPATMSWEPPPRVATPGVAFAPVPAELDWKAVAARGDRR